MYCIFAEVKKNVIGNFIDTFFFCVGNFECCLKQIFLTMDLSEVFGVEKNAYYVTGIVLGFFITTIRWKGLLKKREIYRAFVGNNLHPA